MSLYNNIAESLSSKGLFGSVNSAVSGAVGSALGSAGSALSSAAGSVLGGVGGALGGQLVNTLTSVGQNMATNAAMSLVNKYVPLKVQNMLNEGAGAVGDLLQGNLVGAGMHLLDSSLLGGLLPSMSGLASQIMYWGTPTPLFGGISPTEARNIYNEMRSQKLAKKNLWLIEVSSLLCGDMSQRFNLFATEIEYEPCIIAGEKRRVGGAVVDTVQGAEPVELRLTTIDDQQGTLKRWFAAHHGAVSARDGTVGVPVRYAIKIKVVHAFITRESNRGGYEDIGLFRPVNMAVSLSRREDGLEEIQMSFSQLDTFMRP